MEAHTAQPALPQGMMRTPQCAGCGSYIHDQYILRVSPDLEWHAACLRCVECRRPLDERCTCFVRNGKTYCKNDYVRLFGTKCDKCGDNFHKTDFVMRAKDKVYHMHCFRCTFCQRQLIPGDQFALTKRGLFCKDDHKPSTENNNNNNNNSGEDVVEENDEDCASVCKKGTSKQQQADIECKNESSLKMSVLSPRTDSSDTTVSTAKRDRKSASESKTTRVRTVLNEKQLHTLRTCYNANPRPDALMKEQLVEMTGLSSRVIRVWFQNKRCKDKKREIYLKQLQEQGKSSIRFGSLAQMQAIPLVASSPVRHGSPLSGGPMAVDVHSYQPPWKALTEFALNSDLDSLDASSTTLQHLANQMHGFGMDASRSGMGGGSSGGAAVAGGGMGSAAAASGLVVFPPDSDLRYSTPDDMLADFPEHQSDISSHSE